MEVTSLSIGNVLIMEPVTALTDLLVALVCFRSYHKLTTTKGKDRLFMRYYRFFFLAMGISTTFGGLIGHAFSHYLGTGWKIPGWVISMLAVALAERASIMHARPLQKRSIGNFFSILNIVELMCFGFIVLYSLKFIFVEIHAVYGLLLILSSFEFIVYKRTGDPGSKTALWSVLPGLLALLVHLFRLSPMRGFNYLDLGHMLMALSAYTLYRGVSKMKVYKL